MLNKVRVQNGLLHTNRAYRQYTTEMLVIHLNLQVLLSGASVRGDQFRFLFGLSSADFGPGIYPIYL